MEGALGLMWKQMKTFGTLFYIVSPNETSFERKEDVPNYVNEVIPFFLGLIVVEQVIAYFKKKPMMNVNDAIGSVSQGLLDQLTKIIFRGIQFVAYIWIYENHRLIALPWNSPWTWWLCFLAVDLGYYWLHRASHEINFLWAAHQVHHSSESYNLTTALRQSVLQNYVTWMVYLPVALFVPPSVFLVHNQFNLLFQFWIHTEVIENMGPLEYILNTPSHHRVHHGRNRYSIDKNYAGVLIIWDRMFGTFEPEGEEVVYGLTHPINTFDPFQVQFCHYIHIWRTFWTTDGLKNKLNVLLKGPGWSSGKPRLGSIEDIPDVHAPMPKYNPSLSRWVTGYILLHTIILVLGFMEITHRHMEFSQLNVLATIIAFILSVTSIAAIMDKRGYSSWLEFFRCSIFMLVDVSTLSNGGYTDEEPTKWIRHFAQFCFVASALFWAFHCVKSVKIHAKKLL